MLRTDVGINAGNILMLLTQRGRLTMREIGEVTNCRDMAISLAIGWLLREDKVYIIENNGRLYFELNNPANEIYYS